MTENESVVLLTERARREVLHFIHDAQKTTENAMLRVSVLPGGCSGFKYALVIEDISLEKNIDDIYSVQDGVTVVVDTFSLQYLRGTIIDYLDDISGSGFNFVNPNATGGCGCGISFTA